MILTIFRVYFRSFLHFVLFNTVSREGLLTPIMSRSNSSTMKRSPKGEIFAILYRCT